MAQLEDTKSLLDGTELKNKKPMQTDHLYHQMHFKPKPFMRKPPEINSQVDIENDFHDDVGKDSILGESPNCSGPYEPRNTVNVESSANEANFEEAFRRNRGRDKQRKSNRRKKNIRKRKLKLKSLGTNHDNLRSINFVKKSLSKENRKERGGYPQFYNVDIDTPRGSVRRMQVINLVEGNRRLRRMKGKRRAAGVLRPISKVSVEPEDENLQNVTISSASEGGKLKIREEVEVEFEEARDKLVQLDETGSERECAEGGKESRRGESESVYSADSEKGKGQKKNQIPSNPNPQDLNQNPPEGLSQDRGDSGLLLKNGVKMMSNGKRGCFDSLHLGELSRTGNKIIKVTRDFIGKRELNVFRQERSFNSEPSEEERRLPKPHVEFRSVRNELEPGKRSASRQASLEGKAERVGQTPEANKEKSERNQNGNQEIESQKRKNKEPKTTPETIQSGSERVEKQKTEAEIPDETGGVAEGLPDKSVDRYIRENKRFFRPNRKRAEHRMRRRMTASSLKQSTSYKKKKKFLKNSMALIQFTDVLSSTFSDPSNNHQIAKKCLSNKFGLIVNGNDIFAKTKRLKEKFQRLMKENETDASAGLLLENYNGNLVDLDALYSVQMKKNFLDRVNQLKVESSSRVDPLNVRDLLRKVYDEGPAQSEPEFSDCEKDKIEKEFVACLEGLKVDLDELPSQADFDRMQEGSHFVCRNLREDNQRIAKCYSALSGDYCDLINIYYHVVSAKLFMEGQDQKFSEIEDYFPPRISEESDRRVTPNLRLKNKCFCPEYNQKKLKRIKRGRGASNWTTYNRASNGEDKDKKFIPITNLEKSDSCSRDCKSQNGDDSKDDKPREASLSESNFQMNTSRDCTHLFATPEQMVVDLKRRPKDLDFGFGPCTQRDKGATLEQIVDMQKHATSKLNKFFTIVRQVDSFLLEKLFAGKWEICLLEMNKFFETTAHIEQFFVLIQLLDEDFYWIFKKTTPRNGQEPE